MHVSIYGPSLPDPLAILPGLLVSICAAHIPQAQSPGHSGRVSLRGHPHRYG